MEHQYSLGWNLQSPQSHSYFPWYSQCLQVAPGAALACAIGQHTRVFVEIFITLPKQIWTVSSVLPRTQVCAQAHFPFLVASPSLLAGRTALRRCVVSYSLLLTTVVVTQISVAGSAALTSSENPVRAPLEWCLEASHRQQDGLKSSGVSLISKDSRFQSPTP